MIPFLSRRAPTLFRINETGMLKGRLREALSHVYLWNLAFTARDTPEALAHVFKRAVIQHSVTNLVRFDGEPHTIPEWDKRAKNFFEQWNERDNPYCVIALHRYLDVLEKGGPSILGWQSLTAPAYKYFVYSKGPKEAYWKMPVREVRP